MTLTYEKILQEMQNAFFEYSGENAALLSDIGARFQTVASELFNIVCYSDFALRQSFVHSATGDYLERHAALRGIQRKTASKAYGALTFYAAQPAEQDITVPAHTVCSVAGEPYIQFETTEAGVIPAGEESVTVAAQALEAGSAYNAKANTVTVTVNPPGYIDSVTNEEAFQGGWDDESDEALRKRILSSYRVPPTGLSTRSMEECVLQLGEVLDCHIVPQGSSALDVYLKTKTGTVSAALEDSVENALTVAYLSGAAVSVEEAQRREYALRIMLSPLHGDVQESCEAVRSAVKNYTDSVKIGESVNLADIYSLALHAAPVCDCTVTADLAVNGIIPGSESTYLVPSSITVACYE